MDRSFIWRQGLTAAALLLFSASAFAAAAPANRTDTGQTAEEQCYSANCFSYYMNQQGWMPESAKQGDSQLNQLLEEAPTAAGQKDMDIQSYPADPDQQTPRVSRDCYTVECYLKYYEPEQEN